jgi:hypothetical protein
MRINREEREKKSAANVHSLFARHPYGDRLASVLAVDFEVVIERQYQGRWIALCETYEAGICQRHGQILVFAHEPLQRANFRRYVDIHLHEAAGQQLKELPGAFACATEKVKSLGQYSLARQERRWKQFELLGGPQVTRLARRQK